MKGQQPKGFATAALKMHIKSKIQKFLENEGNRTYCIEEKIKKQISTTIAEIFRWWHHQRCCRLFMVAQKKMVMLKSHQRQQ